MGQIAIYLQNDLERRIGAAAKRDGKSRSRWVAEAVTARLDGHDQFPASFFNVFGSWEDDRSTREILADIDKGLPRQRRASLK